MESEYSPLGRGRIRTNKYREERRKAAAEAAAERDAQRERLLRRQAKLEAAELHFRQERESLARRCKVCSALQAEAWGMQAADWMERRCGACFAALAQHKSEILHHVMRDISPNKLGSGVMQPPRATSGKGQYQDPDEAPAEPRWFSDLFADEYFWTASLSMLEDRIQHLETSDPATAMADLRPEGCHSREIQCQGSEDLSKPQRVGGGNPWSAKHAVAQTADGSRMAVAGGSWTAQGEAEVDEGRADSASEEQRDVAEEKDKSFQDVLSRYRPCGQPGSPSWETGEGGSEPQEEFEEEDIQQEDVEGMASSPGQHQNEVGVRPGPLTLGELTEMLKLAEDCVALGRTSADRKQALQVAGLLREELCDLYAREKRCAHNRRVEEARLRAERRHEAMVATASAEVVTGGRGGNRDRSATPREQRQKTLQARQRRSQTRRCVEQLPPVPWVPTRAVTDRPQEEHPDGFGSAVPSLMDESRRWADRSEAGPARATSGVHHGDLQVEGSGERAAPMSVFTEFMPCPSPQLPTVWSC